MCSNKGLQNVLYDLSVWFSTVFLTLTQIVLFPFNLFAAMIAPD